MVFYHSSRQRTKHKHFNWQHKRLSSVSAACCPLSTWLSFSDLFHSSFLPASRAEGGMALFLKHLDSKRWGRCIFRCSEVRIWILTKYNTNFWGFSLVVIEDVTWICSEAEQYSCIWGSSSSSDNILFSRIYWAPTWHLYLCTELQLLCKWKHSVLLLF